MPPNSPSSTWRVENNKLNYFCSISNLSVIVLISGDECPEQDVVELDVAVVLLVLAGTLGRHESGGAQCLTIGRHQDIFVFGVIFVMIPYILCFY